MLAGDGVRFEILRHWWGLPALIAAAAVCGLFFPAPVTMPHLFTVVFRAAGWCLAFIAVFGFVPPLLIKEYCEIYDDCYLVKFWFGRERVAFVGKRAPFGAERAEGFLKLAGNVVIRHTVGHVAIQVREPDIFIETFNAKLTAAKARTAKGVETP